ncbi:MAG TPA: hypothetical protein VK787_10725 [Puia sp.]|jgi:hypothetical protein|nr:hypothetical protein [Puia sp.]
MVDIRHYLNLSSTAKKVIGIYSDPESFSENYKRIFDTEKKSFLRHYIVANKPYAFDNYPIIFERICDYLSDSLGLNPMDIKLIGSAKTGFAISKSGFGKIYIGKNSDLDFSIINEKLFYEILDEFEKWEKLFKEEKMLPRQSSYLENKYWNENLETGPRQLRRGFIDSKYIPNRLEFPKNKRINSCLFYIKKYLKDIHSIEIKEGTASIYKNNESFINRLKFNTDKCIM